MTPVSGAPVAVTISAHFAAKSPCQPSSKGASFPGSHGAQSAPLSGPRQSGQPLGAPLPPAGRAG